MLLSVDPAKVLGVHLSFSTAVIKKAQKASSSPLRGLRTLGLPTPHLTTFYRGVIENILTQSFTSWFGSCKSNEKPHKHIVTYPFTHTSTHTDGRAALSADLTHQWATWDSMCFRRTLQNMTEGGGDSNHQSSDWQIHLLTIL